MTVFRCPKCDELLTDYKLTTKDAYKTIWNCCGVDLTIPSEED